MAKTRRDVDAEESSTTDSEITSDVGSSSDTTTGSTTKPRSKKAGFNPMATTRKSLLEAIKDPENRQSWVDFFDNYSPFILRIGKYKGLDADMAYDLVIIVMREVSEIIATFDYEAEKGGFRKWLKTVAGRRAIDIHRRNKRFPHPILGKHRQDEDSQRTQTADQIKDFDNALEAMWEKDEAQAILKIACRITKEQVSKRQWQLFECRVLRDWPVDRICSMLDVTPNSVSIAKCRVLPVYQEACIESKKRLDRGPLSPLDKKALDESLPLPSYYAKTKRVSKAT